MNFNDMKKDIVFPNKKMPLFKKHSQKSIKSAIADRNKQKPEILMISTFPPKQCGIATYSQDLVRTLRNKFKNTFKITVAALENKNEQHQYSESVKYILRTDIKSSYQRLSQTCNQNPAIELIVLQHEFGLFKDNETDFLDFFKSLKKPILIALHTVLPNPDFQTLSLMDKMSSAAAGFIVMTNTSARLLEKTYKIDRDKITVIAHGTHLVKYEDKKILKQKYDVLGYKILSTFGLLSCGKSIETTLYALPEIIKHEPKTLFLIIGKTHPCVVKNEGEKYREFLAEKITSLQLENHVKFINNYLPLEILLEYLQLTDIYLFTSSDPNQAVSGTFSYAMNCGCPVISTPIPHAEEVIQDGTGVIIDFGNPDRLSAEVIRLLKNADVRENMSLNGIHKLAPTAWENSAIAHALLFKKIITDKTILRYKKPKVNLSHIKKITTPFGMLQFCVLNKPDLNSGYTLDDNARALIAVCQHYQLKKESSDLSLISVYYNFIKFCQQQDGSFLNYVNIREEFTNQNNENLQDSNGRAIWALGFMISLGKLLPAALQLDAIKTINKAIATAEFNYATRATAFTIKGLYYYNKVNPQNDNLSLIKTLANRLVQMYRHERKPNWRWFESYLTYANSSIPEAMLCAYKATGDLIYESIAKESFDFLLANTFTKDSITVISNKGWLYKNDRISKRNIGGQQPVDVGYTILALARFKNHFKNFGYGKKIKIAFSWFLGSNHLNRIIYNPFTGGCYDGLEENCINLNQGAESTISYLMARLTLQELKCQKTSDSILNKVPDANTKNFEIKV
jgi:glycosyltransferase involved in cell wall biosynthesis